MIEEGILEHREGRKNTNLFSALLPILKEKDHKSKAESEGFAKGRQSKSSGSLKKERMTWFLPRAE